jgi:RNA polymerase sigma factor (sigma-70 family)
VASDRSSTEIELLFQSLCAQEAADRTDGQLLERFLAQRDEAAFAVLLKRHGPMVLGVCRRILGNDSEAEDAFQAAFLVLIRKGPALTGRAVLGDWLHHVARFSALKARVAAARRRVKEQALARPEATQVDERRDEWLALLDEELRRLPEKYRLPLLLCDLEGKTRQEAAKQLGWPEGTVAGRLARSRELLAKRLLKKAQIATGAMPAALAGSTAQAALRSGLVGSTIEVAALTAAGQATATGALSTQALIIARGVMRTMFWNKLKVGALVLLAVLLAGAGGFTIRALAREGQELDTVAEKEKQPPSRPGVEKQPDREKEREAGEKLPAGQVEQLHQNLTAALGNRFEFVEGKIVRDRHDWRYWLATIRAKREGEFVLRCAMKYQNPPQALPPRYDGAHLTYHLVIGKAGARRVSNAGTINALTSAYPHACVGDALVIPVRINPSDTEHRFELPQMPSEREKVMFPILKEVATSGEAAKAGNSKLKIDNQAKDVLELVAGSVRTGGRDILGKEIQHLIQAWFNVSDSGKFNLDIRLQGKLGDKLSEPVQRALEIVAKDRPLTFTIQRWESREHAEKRSTTSTGTLPAGVQSLRVGDRLEMNCGGFKTAASVQPAQVPEVEVVISKKPFVPPDR